MSGSASVVCRRTRKHGSYREPQEHCSRRLDAVAVPGELLEPVDDREDGDKRECGADEIRSPGFGVTVLREHDPGRARGAAPSPERREETLSPTRRTRAARPRRSGPSAPPSENAVIHPPIATVRWPSSWNMFRISESARGCDRRASDAEERPRGDQHLGARRERTQQLTRGRTRLRRSAAAGAGRFDRRASPS